LFGYSAAPEILTLVAHIAYVVAILALYLRPIRRTTPPAQQAATARP
jgi:high-affinity Fe2+/Pb2+ permease